MTASLRAARVAILFLAGFLVVTPARTEAQVSGALDRFERGLWSDGDVPQLEPEALIATSKLLKDGAPAWIAAAGPQQARRRRLAVASYVLHVLRSQEDPYLWQGGGSPFRYQRALPAVDLLEWACGLLRAEPPLVAERWWHLGAIGLLERHSALQTLLLHLSHAHGRFPDEDRWVLGRAIAEELRTWPETRDDSVLTVAPALTASIVGRYEEAITRESIRAEALIRLGYFELRRNRVDAALAQFNKIGLPKDPVLRYWAFLFRGQAFERSKRLTDAIGAYRTALESAPYAQSAVLALASALVSAHRDAEASALVDHSLAMRPAPRDPWAEFTQPDWRFRDRVSAELRKAVAP
jgi:tetratricopeptide (TPR) repeat protein